MYAVDSDEAVNALMGFLTLKPGDTDADFFQSYSSAQMEFAESYAEYLSAEVMSRFSKDND